MSERATGRSGGRANGIWHYNNRPQLVEVGEVVGVVLGAGDYAVEKWQVDALEPLESRRLLEVAEIPLRQRLDVVDVEDERRAFRLVEEHVQERREVKPHRKDQSHALRRLGDGF